MGARDAHLAAIGSALGGDVAVAEHDFALVRRERSREHAQQRRLPRAVRSDDADGLTLAQAEADTVEDGERAEALSYVDRDQDGIRRARYRAAA
jgi:hypothetical protein